MTTSGVYAKKVALVMAVIGLIAVYGWLIVNRPDESPQARRVRLLCETDHEALLQAGREMLSKAPKNLMRYAIGRPIHIDGIPASRIMPIPRVIRKLRPNTVLINLNGYIVLHMQEGLSNYGVKIYPEGFSRPSRDFRFGNRELLPGLWYYDYRYGHDPQYNSIIEQILQTGKRPKRGGIGLGPSNPRSFADGLLCRTKPIPYSSVVSRISQRVIWKNKANAEPIAAMLILGRGRRVESAKMARELRSSNSDSVTEKAFNFF